MNERINQLAKQAGGNYGEGLEFAVVFGELKDLEKFAELIVRECAMQVADVRIENDFEPVGDVALVQAMAGIKKYFGVQE